MALGPLSLTRRDFETRATAGGLKRVAESAFFGETAGALIASSTAAASATGTLTLTRSVTGSSSASGSATGSLTRTLAITGSATASSSGSGSVTAFALDGSATVTSSASGTLERRALLTGSSGVTASGSGSLSGLLSLLGGTSNVTSEAWGFVGLLLPARITTTFDERWASGLHVGDARPQLRVEIRQGRFNRRYAPWFDSGFPIDAVIGDSDRAKPWQAFWEPTEPYVEVPNVNSVELANNFDQKGIASAVITLDNIVYVAEAGGHHTIHRGYLAPLRGYVGAGRDRLTDERGDDVNTNEWFQKLSSKYQITVHQAYGDAWVKTFTGLVDEVDATSNPATLTINARSFGQVLSDEEFFGWNIDKDLRDPVVFIDKDEADNITKGGYDAQASSQDAPTHTADQVNDGDSQTYWRSNDHTGAGNTEWVQISVGEGRYSDFFLGTQYADLDIYVSIKPTALANGANPTLNGGDLTPDEWVDLSIGTVPGTFGGIPYIHLISHPTSDDTQIRSLNDPAGLFPDGEFAMGHDSIIRVSFRNLHDTGAGFRAGVRSLYSRKRTLVADAGATKWVRVGDVSDVVKVVLRWAGFKDWEIESAGIRLGKRLLVNRSMKYMDLIDKVKDGLGYEFFVAQPTAADESIGVPIFRKTLVVAPGVDPVATVTDRNLLTAVSVKQTDENKAYIIRTRGREAKTGDTLGGDTTKRIMYVYRPPWSGLPSAGVIRHVIHTNEKFKNADDLHFAAWYIALQEAIESLVVDAEIPGYPGIDLDDIVVLEDLGTGLTSRLSIREWRSTQQAGENARWTMSLGGAPADVPDVQAVVDTINAARRDG